MIFKTSLEITKKALGGKEFISMLETLSPEELSKVDPIKGTFDFECDIDFLENFIKFLRKEGVQINDLKKELCN